MSGEAGSSKRGNKRTNRSSRSTVVEEVEPGTWECTLCTYKNKSEAFKCDMCETRKGTSTRKPRLTTTAVEHHQIVEKFVVSQQQQAFMDKERPHSHRRSRTGTESPSTSLVSDSLSPGPDISGYPDSNSFTRNPTSPLSNRSNTSSVNNNNNNTSSNNTNTAHERTDNDPDPEPDNPDVLIDEADKSASNLEPESTDFPETSSQIKTEPTGPESVTETPPHQLNKPHSVRRHTPSHKKVSGPLKGVDRNSARTLTVTVNGITVVVTDYKLKNNTGTRKRKNKETIDNANRIGNTNNNPVPETSFGAPPDLNQSLTPPKLTKEENMTNEVSNQNGDDSLVQENNLTTEPSKTNGHVES